jgi:glycosyltransferase involved in cell wall biosynthesis
LRLLYVTPSYYPALKYGGPIVSTHLLNKTLVQQGVTVDVVTTLAGVENRSDLACRCWHELDGVRVMYLPYYGYEHYTLSPQLLWQVLRLASRYNLLHINAVWNFPVLAGSLAGWLRHKPYIISPQGTLYRKAIQLKSAGKKQWYYQLVAKQYLQRAGALHFTCENEQRETIQCLGLKVPSFVVPNGIDLAEFASLPVKGSFTQKYPALQGKRYLLFLGRIHKIKGLDILVQAFQKLALEYPDLYLIVVGPDNDGYGDEVKGWLQQAGLMSKTIFTGMLTGQDKLAAFVDAACFVLPSYSENFGMAVVEAMACGTPVIISNMVGIYEELAKKNAAIVVETKAQSVYDGIKKLLANSHNTQKMAVNGQRLVREYYDVEKVAERMIEKYREVIIIR